MKKIGLVLVLFFAYFCCILNVYAESSDFVYPRVLNSYFGPIIRAGDYGNFNFNSDQYPFKSGNMPYGITFEVVVESLANISNKYHVSGSFTVNFYNQPIVVPTGNLNSCMYLAQNSQNERSYLANCFNVSLYTPLQYENLRLNVIASESISASTSEDGEVTVDIGEFGYQYTFGYEFDFYVNQVNTSYRVNFDIVTADGYFAVQRSDVVSSLVTTPKIVSVPYFTAQNSYFATFFNNLNFNMHGLSSFITIPFAFMNNLTTSPPNTLTFNLFNKNINVPNGESLFWGRSDVATFRTTWNVLVGGLIIYFVYKRLFKFVRKLFDPDNAEVNTL